MKLSNLITEAISLSTNPVYTIYFFSELDALELGLLLFLVEGLVVPDSLLEPGLELAWSRGVFSSTEPRDTLADWSTQGSDWSVKGILSS